MRNGFDGHARHAGTGGARPDQRLAAVLCLLLLPAGCAPVDRLTPLERAIEEAARPILEMEPDAVWTDCYNRLVDLSPASVAYLAKHPIMCRPAAPDDLRVMLHTSLLRLLVHPGARPRLSVNCLETTLNVLHLDIKVDGRRVGTLCRPEGPLPTRWHDLYPAEFDHRLADRVDAEADRLAMRRWWREYRDRTYTLATRRLKPRADDLWRVLPRRYADRWPYQPQSRAIHCAGPPADQVMIFAVTCDYNLVRAACVWLGSSDEPKIRARLIDLVGSSSPIAAHNALFALHYVPDERIRDVLERYKNRRRMERKPDRVPADRKTPAIVTQIPIAARRASS